MKMSEVLCLKWNNHKSIFLQNLSNLRTQELYSDATLTCGGKYFSVHRLVLSTCSEYFEEIFEKISTHSIHPFIIVTNIEAGYLEALLNFMYNGEVNVLHEMLPGLIKAAEILKIKGLAVPDEESLEKEFIYSRERDTNNHIKEQVAPPMPTVPLPVTIPIPQNHVASSPRISPTPRETPMPETHPSTYILPDDINHSVLPPVTSIHKGSFQIEGNVYHTKEEVIEICSNDQPTDYVSTRSQSHNVTHQDENEIKLEDEIIVSQTETIHQHIMTPVPPPIIQAHIPPITQPPQHFPTPPPAHSQPMTIPENAIIHQDPLCVYTTAPPHTLYAVSEKETRKQEFVNADDEVNHDDTKSSMWDPPSNKETDSSAAVVVQEVIQGLLLQPESIESAEEPQENGTPSNTERRHQRSSIKSEETRRSPKPKLKKIITSPPSSSNSSPKKCPKCQYISKYASTLRRHIMFRHTGEKPHQCQHCPYRTAHNFNMKKHMMTHTGEKPFSCPLCSYKATQNCNIKAHMKSHENKLLRAAIKGSKKQRM